MNTKPKIITILGPTSTGKSAMAIEIALMLKKQKIKSEIISADSRQVYTGLDLGTGKITKKEMRSIPHHMLSIISPKKIFSVDLYKKKVEKIILDLNKKNIVPIICGGTGFYIDAILNDINLPKVEPNKKLRKELENKSADELFQILKKLDNVRAESIDKKNPVRLIRAIEIATTLGSVPKFARQDLASKYAVLKIGLKLPDEILKEKIHTRLLARIKIGMIEEVKNLQSPKQGLGLSWKRLEELGLEYRYVSLYLQNKISKEEMIDLLNTKIWQYAKRQKTWFKRDHNIIWLDPRDKKETENVYKNILEFLK